MNISIYKVITFILLMIMCVPAFALDLNRKHYQGIAKRAGDPLDYWVTIDFDDEDAKVNIGGISSFYGAYTIKGKGENATVTIQVPRGNSGMIKTSDGGESFEGNLKNYLGNLNLWILRVPSKFKPTELVSDELKQTISSKDGYTAFIKLEQSEGVACSTSEFIFSPDGRFSMKCDSPSLQEIFENIRGTYYFEGNNMILKTDAGPTLDATIYNDGTYISIPLGRKRGMDMEIILIR